MSAYKSVATLLVALSMVLMAGCQTKLVVSAPTFDSPVIRPAVRTVSPGPGIVGSRIPRPPGITVVQGPLAGKALTPRVSPRPWKYIIIHHSDTAYGGAARFDASHRSKGWAMLGYDFVIGNGTDTRNGLIEVGPRWPTQMPGAHTGTPDHRFNDYGIGICLVGNFEERPPTAAQMDSLARLVAYLQKTYGIPSKNILGHRDCKPTRCPGRYLNIATVRQMAQRYLQSGAY